MPWDDLTTTGAEIKSRSPADFPTLADGALAATDPRVVEARKIVRRDVLARGGPYVLRHPDGPEGFFDALAALAASGGPLADDAAGALASAYRWVAYDAKATSDVDLWADKRRTEERELAKYVAAVLAVAPYAMGLESSSTPGRAASRGRVATYGVGDAPWAAGASG